MSALFVAILCLVLPAVVFAMIPARTIAGLLKLIIPGVLFFAGLGLFVAQQAGLALMVIFLGVAAWLKFGPRAGNDVDNAHNIEVVRSAALEMEINLITGERNGLVLVGAFEGKDLDSLTRVETLLLRQEISEDEQAVDLLDAYLDRRFAGWREDAKLD